MFQVWPEKQEDGWSSKEEGKSRLWVRCCDYPTPLTVAAVEKKKDVTVNSRGPSEKVHIKRNLLYMLRDFRIVQVLMKSFEEEQSEVLRAKYNLHTIAHMFTSAMQLNYKQ